MSKRFDYMVKAIKFVCLMILAPAIALAQDAGQRYVLRSGDEITVQYRYTPEFDQTVRVQPDGFVALEIIGDIKLGGLTISQGRDLIIEKAKVRLKDPEISLSLKEFEKPFFVVAGEVIKPGKFDLHREVTALQAIMLAGGFKDQAKASQVIVFRRIESGLSETHVLNFSQAARKGGKFQDLPLQPGDMLMIPQNTITRVERYMKVANVGLFFNPLQWLF
jgi:polysaccharide export outer membrane protein